MNMKALTTVRWESSFTNRQLSVDKTSALSTPPDLSGEMAQDVTDNLVSCSPISFFDTVRPALVPAWILLVLSLWVSDVELSFAQEYQVVNYQVRNGLPTDIIKSIAQDSLGFFWIATDDGLVRFDGTSFVTYPRALRSQYAKEFLTTRDGRLLAIGDMDLIEIRNNADTVEFVSLLRGTANPSDTSLWYPKSLFEDHRGDLWIGEPQAVLRFSNGRMKRFDFGMENRSSVFIRAFTCFENSAGTLFAVSYQGKVFRLDEEEGHFTQLDLQVPPEVSDVFTRGDVAWLATASGLYSLSIAGPVPSAISLKLPDARNASHIAALNDSTLVVSTYLKDVFLVNSRTARITRRLDYEFRNVNHCYVSAEGELWLSTLKGIFHLQERTFSPVINDGQFRFIESVLVDSVRRQVYFCWKEGVGSVSIDNPGQVEFLRHQPEAYFQCMALNEAGLWVSDRHYLLLFRNGKLYKEWDLSGTGRFIIALHEGPNNSVWISQASNSNLIRINKNFDLDYFPLAIAPRSNATAIEMGRTGMFAAANFNYGYLFFKPHNGEQFKNVSHPLPFEPRQELEVADFYVAVDNVWIATNEGLLRYNGKGVTRVDLGAFTNVSVKSVEPFDNHQLILTNSHGVLLYDTRDGDYRLYNETVGLPSNTLTNRGIAIDDKHRIWAGTSEGLALSVPFLQSRRMTPRPYGLELRSGGIRKRFAEGFTADYGQYTTMRFASITFPASNLSYQYRIEGRDTTWLPSSNGLIELVNLAPGSYQLLVRARKNGGFDWSEATVVPFRIQPLFWQQTWFVLFCAMVVAVIAYTTYKLTSSLEKKRKEKLHQIIEQRTQELTQTNQELIQRNAELDRFVYSASHDLSSPLKSVLGLIEIAKLEQMSPTMSRYLELMDMSVVRLESFIGEVINYSRNTRLPSTIEVFQFREVVQIILDNHQFNKGYNGIRFEVEDITSGACATDVVRFRMVLNNLISNAIKFRREVAGKAWVKIRLEEQGDLFQLTVEDNGVGISERHLPRVFEMFYRAGSDAPGSGLGLYILKEAVAKLRGTVEVKSILGEGTLFTVRFPRNLG